MTRLPRYTVIIAVPYFSVEWGSLNALLESPPPDATQILLAVGRHPSRQRNAAIAVAQGELIVFLDSDSIPDSDYWKHLDASFGSQQVEVVGGPALLRPEATAWEKIFQMQLSHPFVVGLIASRYGSYGNFRSSNQTELILCNMAVRREIFERVGLFAPELFPNEENEWLDRAGVLGTGIYHDPNLIIRRGQQERLSDFLGMIFRNGRGRTHQSLHSRKIGRQQFVFLAVGLFFGVMLVIQGFKTIFPATMLWLVMSLLTYMGSEASLGWKLRLWASFLAPLIPITYACGLLAGFFQKGPGEAKSPVEVVNELGQSVATPQVFEDEMP